ncbi:hypothetical protein QOZ23_15860, partial [Pseudomonas aeruginosa]
DRWIASKNSEVCSRPEIRGYFRPSLEIIDRCQNHLLGGSKVRRHYLHHDYAKEKTEAWRLLGDKLEIILLR